MSSLGKNAFAALVVTVGVIALTVGFAAPASAGPPPPAPCGGISHVENDVTYCLELNGTASVRSWSGTGSPTILDAVVGSEATFPVTAIYDNAFYYSPITSVVFPASLTTIGKSAFESSGLTGPLVFPASLTAIGDRAFFNSTSLGGTLNLPASFTTVGENAFMYTIVDNAIFAGDLPESGYSSSFRVETVLSYCGASTTWNTLSVSSGNCSFLFETGSGTTVPPQTVTFGGQVVAPTSPTRDGYTFSGWSSDVFGTSIITFPSSASANSTAYAVWIAIEVSPTSDPVLAETGFNGWVLGGTSSLLLAVGFGLSALAMRARRRNELAS
jgi:uncharacterized repeat protein (TIGR02543 family)